MTLTTYRRESIGNLSGQTVVGVRYMLYLSAFDPAEKTALMEYARQARCKVRSVYDQPGGNRGLFVHANLQMVIRMEAAGWKIGETIVEEEEGETTGVGLWVRTTRKVTRAIEAPHGAYAPSPARTSAPL